MTAEKDKMLNGELYDASDPELVDDRRRARDLTRQYNRTAPAETDRRWDCLDELLGSHGDRVPSSHRSGVITASTSTSATGWRSTSTV